MQNIFDDQPATYFATNIVALYLVMYIGASEFEPLHFEYFSGIIITCHPFENSN